MFCIVARWYSPTSFLASMALTPPFPFPGSCRHEPVACRRQRPAAECRSGGTPPSAPAGVSNAKLAWRFASDAIFSACVRECDPPPSLLSLAFFSGPRAWTYNFAPTPLSLLTLPARQYAGSARPPVQRPARTERPKRPGDCPLCLSPFVLSARAPWCIAPLLSGDESGHDGCLGRLPPAPSGGIWFGFVHDGKGGSRPAV